MQLQLVLVVQVVLLIIEDHQEQIQKLDIYLLMVVEVVVMMEILSLHHQVMFNQQAHHKETMVVKVDKVGVMVQVEVVEPQLLVELVVHQVVELLLEQVELEQQIV
jgi:hypothetical protein